MSGLVQLGVPYNEHDTSNREVQNMLTVSTVEEIFVKLNSAELLLHPRFLVMCGVVS